MQLHVSICRQLMYRRERTQLNKATRLLSNTIFSVLHQKFSCRVHMTADLGNLTTLPTSLSRIRVIPENSIHGCKYNILGHHRSHAQVRAGLVWGPRGRIVIPAVVTIGIIIAGCCWRREPCAVPLWLVRRTVVHHEIKDIGAS